MGFLTRISLTNLAVGLPVVLLVTLSVALGVFRYVDEYETFTRHSIEMARTGARPIVNLMRLSVGGGNYANSQDRAAIDLFKANPRLLFLVVEGRTDQGGKPFGLIYDAALGTVIRTAFPDDHESKLTKKLAKAEKALKKLPSSHKKYKKVARIAKELRGKLDKYRHDREAAAVFMAEHPRPAIDAWTGDYWLDGKSWKLHLRLPTGNPGGGEVCSPWTPRPSGGCGRRS